MFWLQTPERSHKIAPVNLGSEGGTKHAQACSQVRRAMLQLFVLLCTLASVSSQLEPAPQDDRAALLAFKAGLSSQSQQILGSWQQETDMCSWAGVDCNGTQFVVRLSLGNFSLAGTLPDSWGSQGSFSRLEQLQLHENARLVGGLPSSWGAPDAFPQLRNISLYRCSLTGSLPPAWAGNGSFPQLTELHLNGNLLNGTLPVEAGSSGMRRLRKLKAQRNSLSGPLPEEWGRSGTWPELRQLTIWGNALTGTLPASWIANGSFPLLETMELDQNRLKGSLWPDFGRPGTLPNLKELYLSQNKLTGTLPPQWGEPGRFSNLTILYLWNNSLTGTLPPEWGSEVGAFPVMQRLELNVNNLTGSIPGTWRGDRGWGLTINKLDVSNNRLTGALRDDWGGNGSFPKMEDLWLWDNRFSGTLPPSWGEPGAFRSLETLFLYKNPISGSLPPEWGAKGSFPLLYWLYMTDANLTGPLPDSWATMPRMFYLYLSNNTITGTLPASWGANGSFPILGTLSLYNNRLQGSIPESWRTKGCFPRLTRMLDLSFNQLTGPLPVEWGTQGGPLANLTILSMYANQFNGTLPATWGSRTSFQRLELLWLKGNALTGTLPAEWGSPGAFPRLQSLHTSSNQLGGTLPPQWGGAGVFPALTELRLSNNKFTGPLPDAWSSPEAFPKLTSLVLYSNQLSGPLPASFGRPAAPSRLQMLDLADNAFSGPLPAAWAARGANASAPPQMGALAVLILANNSLSGELPQDWGALDALQILSVGGRNEIGGAIPPDWLQGETLPNLFLLDVGRRVWHNSLASDGWRRLLCLSPALFNSDKFGRALQLLDKIRQTLLLPLAVDFPQASQRDDLLPRLSTQIEPLTKVCSNPDAPEVLAWIWGATLLVALTSTAVYLFLRARRRRLGGGPPGKLVTLLQEARVRGVRRAAAGLFGMAVYWFDVVTDVLVLRNIWGHWPAGPFLVFIVLQYVVVTAIFFAFFGRQEGKIHPAWKTYMAPVAFLGMLVSTPILDTLVTLDYLGIPVPKLHRIVVVDNYLHMRDVVRALFGSLPSGILQSVVYAMGNNPASGLFFSDRLFLESIASSLAQVLKTLLTLLYTAYVDDAWPLAYAWSLAHGGGFLGPSRQLFQLHHAASMPAPSAAATLRLKLSTALSNAPLLGSFLGSRSSGLTSSRSLGSWPSGGGAGIPEDPTVGVGAAARRGGSGDGAVADARQVQVILEESRRERGAEAPAADGQVSVGLTRSASDSHIGVAAVPGLTRSDSLRSTKSAGSLGKE